MSCVCICRFAHEVSGSASHTDRCRSVMLTVTERALLASFSQRPGLVMRRSELLRLLNDEHASTRKIDTYVSKIRKKLLLAGLRATIATVRRQGYRLDLRN